MPYKLKPESVEHTAVKITALVLKKTFASTDKVDGERLIALTNSRQVNSFLIRSLFHQWRKEVEHLESPYFDFKHERVKEALKQFMNVLSNHISIDEAHLKPLLERATADAILISFKPGLYLKSVLDRNDKPQDLKRELKYIKTNRALFKKLLSQIDEFSTKNSIQSIYEGYNPEAFEKIDAEEFMSKLDVSDQIDTLFEFEKPAPEQVPETNHQPELKEEAQQKTAEPNEEEGTLNAQFQGNQKPMTLAEKLQQKMKKSIESGLTLNEKFMFQNALFGGDAGKMKEALRDLDTANSLNEALEKANAFNKGWDMESEEVEALMVVLERRFS